MKYSYIRSEYPDTPEYPDLMSFFNVDIRSVRLPGFADTRIIGSPMFLIDRDRTKDRHLLKIKNSTNFQTGRNPFFQNCYLGDIC